MRALLITLSAALLSQAAWASPIDFPSQGKPTFGAHVTNPCGAQQVGPRTDLGRQALMNNCNRLRLKLQASPNDAALRAQCNRAAKALTGHTCEAENTVAGREG